MIFKRFITEVLALTIFISGVLTVPVISSAKDEQLKLLNGYAISGDWVYYKISDTEAAVVKYNGEDENIIIPSKLDEYTIIKIDGCSEIYETEHYMGVWTGAFENSNIISVVIPETVAEIGKNAYFNCNLLSEITIPDNVKKIGENALGYCLKTNGIVKQDDFKIICNFGSFAYQYAKNNKFDYFLINKGNIDKCEVTLSTSNYKFNGKQCRPVVTVKDSNKILQLKIDYTYTYNNNNTIGTAYIKIIGKGDYSGTIIKNYQILPGNVYGIKASATSANSIKLTWDKVQGVDGYVVYLYNKTLKKWQQYAKTKDGNNIQLINKLNPGEIYAFTVRAYKSVNDKEFLSPSFTNFKTATNPSTVSFRVSSGSKEKVNIKWNKVMGATSYRIYYKPTSDSKWQRKLIVNSKTTSCTLAGIKSGNGYFTVRAYKTYDGITRGGNFTSKICKVK